MFQFDQNLRSFVIQHHNVTLLPAEAWYVPVSRVRFFRAQRGKTVHN